MTLSSNEVTLKGKARSFILCGLIKDSVNQSSCSMDKFIFSFTTVMYKMLTSGCVLLYITSKQHLPLKVKHLELNQLHVLMISLFMEQPHSV
jgi:hypothetical protein